MKLCELKVSKEAIRLAKLSGRPAVETEKVLFQATKAANARFPGKGSEHTAFVKQVVHGLLGLSEMSQASADDVEQDIKRSFLSIGIILVFTKHFTDRIVNGAKVEGGKDEILVEDLFETFKDLKMHYHKIFKEARDFDDELKRGEFEGVIKSVLRKINIPFILNFNSKKRQFTLICKTIMKKNNFHVGPKDHVINI